MLVATFGAFGFGRIQVAHRDASGWEAAQLTNDYSATGGRTFPYHLTPLEQNSFHDVPLSPKEEEIPTEDTYAVLCYHSRSRSPRVAGRPRRRDTISSVRPSFYEAADLRIGHFCRALDALCAAGSPDSPRCSSLSGGTRLCLYGAHGGG